jgi:hypothetical protein
VAAIVEEYFSDSGIDHHEQTLCETSMLAGNAITVNPPRSSLKDKLNRKVSDIVGHAA